MSFEEETNLCASWTNMQEVHIKLNPEKVETATLKGKVLYDSKQIKVMITENGS